MPIEVLMDKFPEAKSSLKEITKDDSSNANIQYLCDGNEAFLSFDTMVKSVFPIKQPASFDMLIGYKDKLFCIEFKNSTARNIENRNVQNKAIEGIAALYKIAQICNLNIEKYKKYFIVIYKRINIDINTKSQNRLHERADKKVIDFGLSKYKDTFYDKIITAPCKDYKYIRQRLSIK